MGCAFSKPCQELNLADMVLEMHQHVTASTVVESDSRAADDRSSDPQTTFIKPKSKLGDLLRRTPKRACKPNVAKPSAGGALKVVLKNLLLAAPASAHQTAVNSEHQLASADPATGIDIPHTHTMLLEQLRVSAQREVLLKQQVGALVARNRAVGMERDLLQVDIACMQREFGQAGAGYLASLSEMQDKVSTAEHTLGEATAAHNASLAELSATKRQVQALRTTLCSLKQRLGGIKKSLTMAQGDTVAARAEEAAAKAKANGWRDKAAVLMAKERGAVFGNAALTAKCARLERHLALLAASPISSSTDGGAMDTSSGSGGKGPFSRCATIIRTSIDSSVSSGNSLSSSLSSNGSTGIPCLGQAWGSGGLCSRDRSSSDSSSSPAPRSTGGGLGAGAGGIADAEANMDGSGGDVEVFFDALEEWFGGVEGDGEGEGEGEQQKQQQDVAGDEVCCESDYDLSVLAAFAICKRKAAAAGMDDCSSDVDGDDGCCCCCSDAMWA